MLNRFWRDRRAKLGLAVLGTMVIAALTVPLWKRYDPYQGDLQKIAFPPTKEHWFGTDELGRDIFTRIFYGARISLTLGCVSVGIGLLTGIPLGALAAYWGGFLDLIVMRFVDILLAFPPILLAIAIVSVLGPGLYNAMIAVGISLLPFYARLVRGSVLVVKEQNFVEAARAVGSTDFRIIWRHILPNCVSPILVQSTFNIASALLTASSLGFLGLGAQPPLPEWGTMLSRGRTYLRVAPHVTVFPGLAIFLAVLAFNLLGDSLRDALDPYMIRGKPKG